MRYVGLNCSDEYCISGFIDLFTGQSCCHMGYLISCGERADEIGSELLRQIVEKLDVWRHGVQWSFKIYTRKLISSLQELVILTGTQCTGCVINRKVN